MGDGSTITRPARRSRPKRRARGLAERALRESEQKLRAIFEQAAVGITSVDLRGVLIDANQKFCDMVGYGRDELLGKTIQEITHPDDFGAGARYRHELMQGEMTSVVGEKRFLRRDGTAFWARRTMSAGHDEAGRPQFIISVVEDITDRKEAELRYQALFESAPVGMMRTALDRSILEVNPKLCEIVGYTAEELAAMRVPEVLLTQDIDEASAFRDKLVAGEIQSYQLERELKRKDGSAVWVSLVVTLIRDGQGQPLHFVTMMQDVSERRRGEQALLESEEKFRQLAENVPEAFWVVDAKTWQLIYLNRAGEAMVGQPLGNLSPDTRTWLRLVHPEDRLRVRAAKRHLLGNQGYEEEFRIVRKDGSVRWLRECAFPVHDANGQVYRVAGISADITQRKEAEQKLVHLAHYDALTGLPNRVLFYDRLKQGLAQARRNGWGMAVIFLDLDRFKNVNDTLGHAVGDELLNEAAVRLLGCVRAGDTVGRLGGDEFAIVLSNISGQRDASVVAQKIMVTLADPFVFEGGEVFVTASIGITLYPNDSTDQDALIRNADTAMYRAKDLGRNSCQFYAPEMNARALEKLSMESSLRRALERREFLLYYQPKVSLATGEVTGVEALMRWRHPELGLVPPAEFMPMLEETGLIMPAGEWVIRAACEQVQAWRKARVRPVPIAVNLSARQFQAKDLAETVCQIMAECGVEGRLLEMEITESSLVGNTEEAVHTLDALGALGIRIAIDDFGTGYSNLNYLKRFPLDALKIDSSFVRDVITDLDDAAITRAIITMAHYLDLSVIAEGVETEQQLAFLHANGCDEMQGYYFSRPLPADDCAAVLASGRRLQHAAVDGEIEAPAVLLVDDDEDVLLLLKRELTADDYPVFTTTDPREGLKLLDLHNIRVVVSDYSMPGMSGIDFLERVKALHPDTVRIMLTSHADFDTVTRAVNKTGIYRFVSKDWGSAHLRADIRQALASSLQAGPTAGNSRRRQPRPA
jgi:diguanylate cyclase (GGDEF)-like protein/PAS domain S-box-containing protein